VLILNYGITAMIDREYSAVVCFCHAWTFSLYDN